MQLRVTILVFIAFVFTTSSNVPLFCNDDNVLLAQKFVLLTTLYNEKDEKRRNEFITCIEKNLKHPMIGTVHVFYDTCKDDQENLLLKFLQSKNVKISFIEGRARYVDLFDVANTLYFGRKIIVSNADIYFDETLNLLIPYDLSDKFLALTRWDVDEKGLLKAFSSGGNSQDTWIFQSPIPSFRDKTIKMGILGCENAIAYQSWIARLDVHNPSLSIHCCHLHLSAVRNYNTAWTYSDNTPTIPAIAKETLQNIFPQ